MFKRMSVALLGSACTFVAGMDSAAAFDTVPNEPVVMYAPRTPPVRTAYNQHPNMGGGFIEFLFGGEGQGQGQVQGQAYYPQQQQPVYQQQPAYYGDPRLAPMGDPAAVQQDAADPRQRPFDPRYEKQLVDYSGKEGAGTIV